MNKNIIEKILIFACVGMAVFCLLMGWKQQSETEVYCAPDRKRENIEEILDETYWDKEKYRMLFYQTGLGRRVIESIPVEERKDTLLKSQQAFFLTPTVECSANSVISWQEENTNLYLPEINGLEEGDILVSFCSHTFGWRNGHAAIVVDAKKGKTLEAVFIGRDSCLQSVQKWRKYPSFLVLRLKDTMPEVRKEIAEYALENLEGIQYGFVTDVIEHFWGIDRNAADTDCAHLIWRSFFAFGYDLDSDGGLIVTPRDIAESPLLEIVQVYGIDLDTIQERKSE